MRRRRFLKGSAALGGLALIGAPGLTRVAAAMDGPYGPLQAADANGVRLPDGFSSRIVAGTGSEVYCTGYTWHPNPDGGAVFAQDDGGWIYVSNDESGFGGVSSLRFDRWGEVTGAASLLSGSSRNCAGGATPWGTWLSCEEVSRGRVWECDPLGVNPPVTRLAMGRFNHEAAAADNSEQVIYLTEDTPDGALYRFTPESWGDLSSGLLEVMTETEVEIPDPDDPDAPPSIELVLGWAEVPDPAGNGTSTRYQVEDTKPFNGGEGAWFDSGLLYFTTKGDNRVWTYDPATVALDVIYDRAVAADPVLSGVDNITVSPAGDIFVCEDGGNMEVVILSTEGEVAPFLQVDNPGSELTGVAFDPWGTRMYLSSQRSPGITYEITGPFRTPLVQPPAGVRPDPGQGGVTGTVAFADGTPPPSMSVQLFEAQGDGSPVAMVGQATTDLNGQYAFAGFTAGLYAVTMTAPDGEVFGNGSTTLTQRVCIEADQTMVLDGELALVGFFTGRVTTAAGAPAVDVTVDLFEATGDGSRGSWLGDAQTNGSGRYNFEVERGCYVLTFIAPEGRLFENGSQYLDSYQCVEPNQTVTTDVRFEPSVEGSLGGTVTYNTGAAAANVVVDLFTQEVGGARGQWLSDTRTAADGTYNFDVADGSYVLTFIAPQGENFVGGGEFFEIRVVGGGGLIYDNLDAQLDGGVAPTATIGGTVTMDDGGAAASGVTIDLFESMADGSRGSWLGDTTTAVDGSYSFDVLAACYVLTFIAPAGLNFVGGGQYLGQAICVDPGQVVNNLDATLA